jgi:hypothetical protein
MRQQTLLPEQTLVRTRPGPSLLTTLTQSLLCADQLTTTHSPSQKEKKRRHDVAGNGEASVAWSEKQGKAML